jgi:Tfp pilus assembly protein PilO
VQLNKMLTYAAAFVIALIILLSGALVIMPQVDAAAAARAETATVNAENAAKEIEIALLAAEFARIDGLRNELAGLRTAIPSGVDTPTLLGQLSEIADAHGVTLDSIGVGEPLAAVAPPASDATGAHTTTTPAAMVVKIPVSLSVAGESAAVVSFIGGLQTSDRIISVTAFSTSTGAATDAVTGDVASVTASISAVVYGLPTP